MKILIGLCLSITFFAMARSYNHNHLPVDLERAMRICIIQTDGFGRAYVVETLNGDLTTVGEREYFKALRRAKNTLYKEYKDKIVVEKACKAIGGVYVDRTPATLESTGLLTLCKL